MMIMANTSARIIPPIVSARMRAGEYCPWICRKSFMPWVIFELLRFVLGCVGISPDLIRPKPFPANRDSNAPLFHKAYLLRKLFLLTPGNLSIGDYYQSSKPWMQVRRDDPATRGFIRISFLLSHWIKAWKIPKFFGQLDQTHLWKFRETAPI